MSYDFGEIYDQIAGIGGTVAPGGSSRDYKPCEPIECPTPVDIEFHATLPDDTPIGTFCEHCNREETSRDSNEQ